MSHVQPYVIAIVGEAMQLNMACCFLSNALQKENVRIIPVLLSRHKHTDNTEYNTRLKHAFSPFTQSFSPMLKELMSSAGLRYANIDIPHASESLKFNFSNYGMPSASINFHQAFEVARNIDSTIPALDTFIEPSASPSGVVYDTQDVKQYFQQLMIQQDLYSITTESIETIVTQNKLTHLLTEDGQTINADLFIDCSDKGILARQLQARSKIATQHIPKYSREVIWNNQGADCYSNIKVDKSAIHHSIGDQNSHQTYKYTFKNDGDDAAFFNQPWFNNCVAIGNAYCNLPELLICRDRILESQLQTLVPFIPPRSHSNIARNHFNTISGRVLHETIDTINLLLQATDLDTSLTESNTSRMALFSSSASEYKHEDSMISNNCWGALMRCIGANPNNTNALAQARSAQSITQKVKQLAKGASA